MMHRKETPEQTIERWKREYEAVHFEAQELAVSHHIFKRVKDIIVKNPTAKQPSSFHSWFNRVYGAAAVITVRRLMGQGANEISFRRLLDDIKRNSRLISVERHVGMWVEIYGRKSRIVDAGRCDFECVCGKGNTHLQGRDVKNDTAELERLTTRIVELATDKIAHHLDREPATLPTYGDIGKAIDCLEKLIQKYGVLLNGNSTVSLLPTWQYDWTDIFRTAWLPPKLSGLAVHKGFRMKLEPSTIQAAFDMHHQRYGSRPRAWDIPYHVDCWRQADEAFGKKSFDQFNQIYEELRRKWQVFRGADGQPWTATEAFDRFVALDAVYGKKRLSECLLDDSDGIWRVLEGIEGIKPNKHGPSIVAMSKFLHFWNPRLFVIVDNGVIWQSVLSHWWLWEEVVKVRSKVEARLPGKRTDASDAVCDMVTYVSILLWAAELVRANPQISSGFADYVGRHADGNRLPLAEYEGAAVEWFLLGLVELPPAGVK